jgi:hypothetical protein
MSDDSIVAFLLAACLMFVGIGVTPLLVGKRGMMFSIVLGVLFLIAGLAWSTIKTHVGPELHGSLSAAASNAYVWLALLGVTWAYFAAINLTQMPRRRAREPYQEPPKPPLPDSFQVDAKRLTTTLMRNPEWEAKHRVQILHGNSDKCARLAREFGQILKDANWEEVSPPTLIGTEMKIPKGVSLRSSRSAPAANARSQLRNAFSEIGIDADSEDNPELRVYDYCFMYFVE